MSRDQINAITGESHLAPNETFGELAIWAAPTGASSKVWDADALPSCLKL